MPRFSDSTEIERPPEVVWRAIGTLERWLEGYLETRSRSADHHGLALATTPHPKEGRGGCAGHEHLLPAPALQRCVSYGTSLQVDADVSLKGLGKLAAPIALRDIKKPWETSLEKLNAATEAGQ
jgi:hypothetical protein